MGYQTNKHGNGDFMGIFDRDIEEKTWLRYILAIKRGWKITSKWTQLGTLFCRMHPVSTGISPAVSTGRLIGSRRKCYTSSILRVSHVWQPYKLIIVVLSRKRTKKHCQRLQTYTMYLLVMNQ